MSFTPPASVTGPQPNREALGLDGIDRTDISPSARRADAGTFSELLNETIAKAPQSTSNAGQSETIRTGHVAATSETPAVMSRGKIVNTGKPLDLAIEGQGCFVLTDGQRDVYARTGSFAIDANLNVVDPATGYHLKRIGANGEADGFQTPGSSSIRIPYNTPLPAKATSEITVSGNLSANGAFPVLQKQKIASDMAYTYDNGTPADETTRISRLDQYSGVFASGTVTFGGCRKNGEQVDTGLPLTIDQSTTLGDIIGHLNANVLDGATASLVNGRIQIIDDVGGYSRTDMTMSYSGEGSLATGAYFNVLTPGAEESCDVEFNVCDSRGGKHALSAAFVRTNTPNTWDMVLTSMTGDTSELTISDRRINGINFDADTGSYVGPRGSDPPQFVIAFASDKSNPQTIRINMGTEGQLNGLTQFAGNSTAGADSQDGYGPGALSTVSVDNRGTIVGAFSNGVKKDIGTVQIAMFRNTAGLERISNGYYVPTAGSGAPLPERAMAGGAGAVHSGALEKSDSDVATDFINMIQAQNSYRPNDILKELTGLIG